MKNKNQVNPNFVWSTIESYFQDQHLKRLVRHQVESYNDFINNQIEKTIHMFNPVTVHSLTDYNESVNKYKLELELNFDNFNLNRPQIHENNGATKTMFPQEARLRNFTYASIMTVDINLKIILRSGKDLKDIQTFYKTLPKIHIGKMPIMLKSDICVLTQYKHLHPDITKECRHDPGGYFIINGSEKTVLGQERAAENKVYITASANVNDVKNGTILNSDKEEHKKHAKISSENTLHSS